MSMAALDEIAQQWQFAADAMPQLICVVDRGGRIIRANRTLERWGLGRVEKIADTHLHDALHRHCGDPACYLRLLLQDSAAALERDGRAACTAWDPLLKRHLDIRIQMPVHEAGAEPQTSFAVVMVDDVTAFHHAEGQPGRVAQIVNRRVEHEVQKRAEAEKIQLRLRTILDMTPALTAMADRSGKLFYLNPAGRTLIGLQEQEQLPEMTLVACHAPAARARMVEEILPAAERDGIWSGDSVLIGRDGCEIKVYLTLIAHRDEQGKLEGYSLLARDMGEWVRIEEALRLTQNELRRLSAQHLTIQESERRRIAVDLHDGLGQTLSLVKLSVEEAARSARDGAPGKTAAALERLAPTVKSALAELRRLSMNLRPATLDDLGILATLAWYFREFEAACPNITLERDISVKESDVAELLKIAIFRIVQEATGNALKHAGANRIKVSLSNEGEALELLIEDTGRGFDPAAVVAKRDFEHGLGLQSMKERAELSGASYEIRSAPGQGTSICVRWPSQREVGCNAAAMSPASTRSLHSATRADHRPSERSSACPLCMTRTARK